MSPEDDGRAPNGKYNAWCHRQPLPDRVDALARAQAFLSRNDLGPNARAAHYFHEMTRADGLEFVAFSNAKLEDAIDLAEGLSLHPCFLLDPSGRSVDDPLVASSRHMEQKGRFVYDGWMPIAQWDDLSVNEAIQSIEESFALVSLLVGRAWFAWEPKYGPLAQDESTYRPDESVLAQLRQVSDRLASLQEADRAAAYRSIGWLAQGTKLSDPAGRLLFAILAIESLASYIESDADDDSAFSLLRSSRLPKVERQRQRDECIDRVLAEELGGGRVRTIQDAYFNCVVGIKSRIRAHLEQRWVEEGTSARLFDVVLDATSLYDLRNQIAHGSGASLGDADREAIRRRVYEAERLARH